MYCIHILYFLQEYFYYFIFSISLHYKYLIHVSLERTVASTYVVHVCHVHVCTCVYTTCTTVLYDTCTETTTTTTTTFDTRDICCTAQVYYM